MGYTVPNQKVLTIHREPLAGSFLGINNDNWKSAARVLGAQAFLLYIYLASNKDDFKLALSPKAIQQEIGMPTSTYRDQMRKLESLGYIVHDIGYHFYECPRDTRSKSTDDALNFSEENTTTDALFSAPLVQETTPKDREIYINNKSSLINSPEALRSNMAPVSKDENKREPFVF